MHFAGVADELGSHAIVRLVTAHDAVPPLVCVLVIVLTSQRVREMEARSTLLRRVIGWQLLEQLMYELLPEMGLADAMLRGRSGLECGRMQIAHLQHISPERS